MADRCSQETSTPDPGRVPKARDSRVIARLGALRSGNARKGFMHRLLGLVLGLAWAALTPGAVRAEPAATGVAMYALVVGSNAGGAGQLALRYAEDDAQRVAATLVELGGYSADTVDVVVHPTPDALRARLDRLGARVTADRASGRQARVMFYYSGHARSTALDLGREEIALAELRQR